MKSGWKFFPAHMHTAEEAAFSSLTRLSDTMHLRILIFALIMLSARLISAKKDESMEARQPSTEIVNIPDDSLQHDSDPDLAVAQEASELPTCLMCVCLSGSVYCEEVSPDLTAVPSLPKETAYLYARFNKIRKISKRDFADMATLRRIDLTGNLIAEIEDRAFSELPQLQELNLAENLLTRLPMLPTTLVSFNVNSNRLKTQGVKTNAFKKLTSLAYLYLGDNELTAVPQLPESLHVVHLHNNKISTITDETFCKGNTSHYIRSNLDQVRLDGNPIKLSGYPNSFICLESLPVGWYN